MGKSPARLADSTQDLRDGSWVESTRGLEQSERLEVADRLSERARPERGDAALPRPADRVEAEPAALPLDARVVEAGRIAIALLEQQAGPAVVEAVGHERRGEKQVEKPEHRPADAVGLIGEPILGAERMVQTGGRLERHIRRETC